MKLSSRSLFPVAALLFLGTVHGQGLRRTREANKAEVSLLAEDAVFFSRLLQGDGSMPPVIPPTDAPVVKPTNAPVVQPTDAPVVPPTDAPVVQPTDAPVAQPTEAPVVPPTEPPSNCPVTVSSLVLSNARPVLQYGSFLTQTFYTYCWFQLGAACVSTDGTPCEDLAPPESGSGDGCIVNVEYTYTLTNDSNDDQQIFSLTEIRNGVTTDITSSIPPNTILAPGETFTTPPNAVTLDLCSGETVETQADLFTGPPIAVAIQITCVSEDGVECAAIQEQTDPNNCLIDVTYTYTITNTGQADTSFVTLNRIRNGETVDLLPLLDGPNLMVGESTVVTETEEIDQCITQDFTTTTQVVQSPLLDNLCGDTVLFP